MLVFRKYMDEKLSDSEYNINFHDNCAIYPTTTRIITALSNSSAALNEIASMCDTPKQIIRDLETAEKSCVASVKKLCDYFCIPQHGECLQN